MHRHNPRVSPRLKRHRTRTLCAAALLALCIAALSGVTAAQAQDAETHRLVKRWTKEIEAIEKQLKAQKWGKGEKSSNRLLDEMCDSIVTGGESFLGVVATLRSVALAGSDNFREAAWDRQVALQLFPLTAEIDLQPFGEVGETVIRFPPPGSLSSAEKPLSNARDPFALQKVANEEVLPPRKLFSPAPKFPKALRAKGQTVSVVVEMVIDQRGIPRNPKIADRAGPVPFVFSALDTVKDWRFSPATQGGEPVTVIYNLTVNYTL